MADNRYRDHRRGEGSRWRDDSIFSSDDRGRGRDDDRGFFDRAGDEVRSWFGDDDAERRRERDARRDEAREAFGRERPRSEYGRDHERSSYGGRRDEPWGGGDYGYSGSQGGFGLGGGGYSGSRSFGGSQAGYGENRNIGGSQRETASGGSGGGRSDWDDNYLRWRNTQIEQLDREYDEYCRHRQKQFESDFHGWRESRKRDTSQSGDSARPRGDASGSTADLGKQGAGATTAGGGTGSANESSTGTSNRPASRNRAGSSTRSPS
jgi:hypothetical protein